MSDLTVEILKDIRQELRGTNERLEKLGDRLDARIDETNQRLDETNRRLVAEAKVRRQAAPIPEEERAAISRLPPLARRLPPPAGVLFSAASSLEDPGVARACG